MDLVITRVGDVVIVPQRSGFFGRFPESEFFSPPLTTIRQDFGAVGRRSIEVLLRHVEGGQGRERLVVPPTFVHRGSTVRR
ncbi:substrate-binding domain-containing protein [Nonomuraea sp. NPDC005983]|uniref:substrate-binding domain-containing protein n=1 Tax=Nonomuraea sp. NPDC005983 TaxID=3155595 RepID=UPI0033AEA260